MKMESTMKVSILNELRICQNCEKLFVPHDIIPLCPECRYEEAKHQV